MARPQKRSAEPAPEAFEIPEIPAEAWVLAPSPVRLADGAFEPIDSPARALQAELVASFADRREDEHRWSARRSLAVIIGASLVGWIVLIATARALLS